MSPLLTISIPTYNRPAKLCARLVELLPQIGGREDVEIIVVDNASAEPSEGVIRAHFGGELPNGVQVRRNVVNVGLAANICRCFEHSSGLWTWILGDDDSVYPDALAKVLESLARDSDAAESTGIYCFSSGIDRNECAATVRTIEELFRGFESHLKFSNFLFISSKIFLTRAFRDRARLAYHYCYSLAPHLAVSLSILDGGLAVRYEEALIVDWKQPEEGQKWSCNLVAAGLPTLAEIHGAGQPVMKHLSAGLELMLWKPFLRGGVDYILFDDDRGPNYWFLMVLRLLPFLRGGRRVSACLLLILGLLVVAMPQSRPLLGKLLAGFRVRMSDEDLTNDRN